MMQIERVEVRGVVKSFGTTAALRGIDASFEPGLTLVSGPNGSGKTTLLRIMATLSRPTAGTVCYEPLGEEPEQARLHLGVVAHELLVYPELSGRENVELAAALHGLAPTVAWQSAAERFGLNGLGERPVRTYSRGQRQRVALARGLVHEPSLVLLDEPATGLDSAGVSCLVSVIERLLGRGAIVVMVSHEAAGLPTAGARRLVLERGRVVGGDCFT